MAKIGEIETRGLSWWRVGGWSFAAALILTPLIAMQFTREVNWTPADFVFAIVMIGSVGGAFELTVRATGNWAYRAGAGIALLTGFLLIWINGAVGIIGSENDPVNLLFLGVGAIALGGSAIARFRAAGMARAMFAAMLAQTAIAFGALIAGLGATEPPGPIGILMLNGIFAGLWLIAGALFRSAARGVEGGSQ